MEENHTDREAIDNVYSLFKQNVKSCKRRRQRRSTVKRQQ